MRKLLTDTRVANVLARLALFIAVGGTSYAAVMLPKNSVGTRQMRARAVTLPKISTSRPRSRRHAHVRVELRRRRHRHRRPGHARLRDPRDTHRDRDRDRPDRPGGDVYNDRRDPRPAGPQDDSAATADSADHSPHANPHSLARGLEARAARPQETQTAGRDDGLVRTQTGGGREAHLHRIGARAPGGQEMRRAVARKPPQARVHSHDHERNRHLPERRSRDGQDRIPGSPVATQEAPARPLQAHHHRDQRHG